MGSLVPGKQMGDIGSAVLIFRYSPDYILEPFSSAARAEAKERRRRTSGDSSGLNVPPVAETNVPGIAETNVPAVAE